MSKLQIAKGYAQIVSDESVDVSDVSEVLKIIVDNMKPSNVFFIRVP